MKKYLGFLIVLSVLTFGGIKVEATNDIGCSGGAMYSPITGQLCNNYSNGCTAGALYSVTTGQLCSNTTSSFGVVSPNGGEVYQAGQQVIVKWNPGGYSSSAKVSIALATLDSSGSSSNTFLIDVNSLKNDGIEKITIPVNTPGASNYVMYLTIFESSNEWQSDRSDNTFTVRSNNEIAPITRAPSITILSPNGGEVYQAGQQIELKWKTNDIPKSYKVIFTLRQPITDSSYGSLAYTENDGSELITLPTDSDFSTIQYGNNFKISARVEMPAEGNVNVQDDFSDNLFAINSPNGEINPSPNVPSITVLSPNGGEVYKAGNKMLIKWSSADTFERKVSLGLVNLSGVTYSIVNDIYDSGSYTWTIPSKLYSDCEAGKCEISFGQNFKIVMSDEGNPRAYDISDNFFTINSPNNDINPSPNVPSITVLSPNGGETFTAGKKMTVTWNTDNFNGLSNDVVIALHQNGEWENVVYLSGSTKNDGSETFVIPNVVTGNYMIRVGHASASVKQDFSDSTFFIKENSTNPSVCSSNNQPSITVLSPNGGENFIAGQQTYITWKSCDNYTNSQVMIVLKSTQSSYGSEIATVPNTGKARITIPSTLGGGQAPLLSGNYYKISAQLGGSAMGRVAPTDLSDNTFTIDNSVNIPDEGCKSGAFYSLTTGRPCSNNNISSITVLSPNGGEVYQAGQQMSVRWSTINIPAGAKITPVLNYVSEANIVKSISLDPVLNTGNTIITIPNSILVKAGKYYEISLVYEISTAELGALIRDRSDNLFTINFKNPNEIAPYETAPSTINNEGCVKGALYSSTTGLRCPVTLVAPTATANSNLMKGIVSNEVKTVQSALTKQGYTLTADGKFGPKTEEAVKKFQAMKGLPVTGIIDDTTMSMILSYILGL